MSRHYNWQRQPRWPSAVIWLAAVELGITMAIAGMLVWRAL
jgi:hypothetical protein